MSYLFVCSGTPQHTSYSASKEQHDPSCPECGASTTSFEEVEITEDMTLWFPGIYNGRQGVYAKTVGELSDEDTITLVRHRVQEDGEWAIENGHVGENNENEPLMRKMMEWASDPTNIAQCLEHIYKEENAHIRTVDWVCRDMANASKWLGGGGARD